MSARTLVEVTRVIDQPHVDRYAVAAHDILRLKGFLAVPGKELRQVVQGVGTRIQHYFDRPWAAGEARSSRLVVIGRKGSGRHQGRLTGSGLWHIGHLP